MLDTRDLLSRSGKNDLPGKARNLALDLRLKPVGDSNGSHHHGQAHGNSRRRQARTQAREPTRPTSGLPNPIGNKKA